MRTLGVLSAVLFLSHMVCASPLHTAVRNGDVGQVKRLLAADAKLSASLDDQGNSPLMLALTANSPVLCKAMLDGGADPNQRIGLKRSGNVKTPKARQGTTALHLFAGMALDLPATTAKEEQARFNDAHDARILCLKLLLAAKADVTAADEAGNTPLHIAIQAATDKHPNLDVIQLLVSKMTVNLQGARSESPLSDAVDAQQYDIAKMLIANGANANLSDVDGMTPLHKAVITRNIRLVQFLLDNKANPAVANKVGKTPRQLAAEQHDPIIAKLLGIQ